MATALTLVVLGVILSLQLHLSKVIGKLQIEVENLHKVMPPALERGAQS